MLTYLREESSWWPTTCPSRSSRAPRPGSDGWTRNHAKAEGVWLKLAKKASPKRTVSYPEAVEVALCYGWIDGQTRGSTTTTTSSASAKARAGNWSSNRDRGAALIDEEDAAAGARRDRAGEGRRAVGRREP